MRPEPPKGVLQCFVWRQGAGGRVRITAADPDCEMASMRPVIAAAVMAVTVAGPCLAC